MILFPLYDDNEEGHSHHHHDFVHWGIIIICAAVFAYEMYLMTQGLSVVKAFIKSVTFDPAQAFGRGYTALQPMVKITTLLGHLADVQNLALVKIIASSFVHASPAHLFFNMLALWFIGDNVEYVMGHLRYFLFFIFACVFSECFNIVMSTANSFGPAVGASGALFAVAGVYLLYFPRAKIHIFYFAGFFWGTFPLPAVLVLGLDFIGQVMTAIQQAGTDFGKIAVWAHIGGFICGALLAFPLRRKLDHPLYRRSEKPYYQKNLGKVLEDRLAGKHKNDDHWGNH